MFQSIWQAFSIETVTAYLAKYSALVPVKGTAGPVERHGVLQTLTHAPVVRAKRCPTSSKPALLPSWTVVCLSFTLLMMMLLPGSPTMGLNRIRKKKKKCFRGIQNTGTVPILKSFRRQVRNTCARHSVKLWLDTDTCLWQNTIPNSLYSHGTAQDERIIIYQHTTLFL